MAKSVGANTNTSDEVTNSTVSVDSITAVTLIPAATIKNPYARVSIYNSGNKVLWLRFYPASQDNNKVGERLLPGAETVLELPNMPVTEISGIMNSGGANNVYVQYI